MADSSTKNRAHHQYGRRQQDSPLIALVCLFAFSATVAAQDPEPLLDVAGRVRLIEVEFSDGTVQTTAAANGAGATKINQDLAVQGGVTPSDLPGFPVTIDTSGSYRLTSNLTVPDENTTAVQIAASDVSLDLGGFAIEGVATQASSGGSGVGVSCGIGCVIKNGKVRGMGSNGVVIGARSRVEGVISYWNRTGISMATDSAAVGVNASRNRLSGIEAAGDCLITGSIANENTEDGIRAIGRCVITQNVASDNDQRGLQARSGSIVLQNTVNRNGSFGMSLDTSVGYAGNNISENNGGDLNLQVSDGGIQLGLNICGGDTICP